MSIRSQGVSGLTTRGDFVVPSTASANSSALTAQSAKAPSATAPETSASTGRYIFGDEEVINQTLILLGFVLTDAANETASANVWSWQRCAGGLWVPKLLCTLAVTAGARTGISGAEITNSEYFADTITDSVDNTVRGVNYWAASDGVALAEIDHMGGDLIEVEVSINSSTAASIKPIVRGF